jgi:hypothetical protein
MSERKFEKRFGEKFHVPWEKKQSFLFLLGFVENFSFFLLEPLSQSSDVAMHPPHIRTGNNQEFFTKIKTFSFLSQSKKFGECFRDSSSFLRV